MSHILSQDQVSASPVLIFRNADCLAILTAEKNEIRPANDCPEYDLKFHTIMIIAERSYLQFCISVIVSFVTLSYAIA
jgi:hypothetical protein